MFQFTAKLKKEIISKALASWSLDTYCVEFAAQNAQGKLTDPTDISTVKWCAFGKLIQQENLYIGSNLGMSTHKSEDICHDYYKKYQTTIADDNDKKGYDVVRFKLLTLY